MHGLDPAEKLTERISKASLSCLLLPFSVSSCLTLVSGMYHSIEKGWPLLLVRTTSK